MEIERKIQSESGTRLKWAGIILGILVLTVEFIKWVIE